MDDALGRVDLTDQRTAIRVGRIVLAMRLLRDRTMGAQDRMVTLKSLGTQVKVKTRLTLGTQVLAVAREGVQRSVHTTQQTRK